MEREHAPHRAPSPVLPAYRQTPSHRPITADLAHLQRAVGNRTASRMIAVQRNLEEVRASYNKTQDPPPKKDRILKKIRNDLNAIAENPAEEVKRIAAVRESLDVVLSVFSDGLGVHVAQIKRPKLEWQSMVKGLLVEARMLCETVYRGLLNSPDLTGTKGQAALGDLKKLQDLWAEIVGSRSIERKVQETLGKTAKTGQRETGGDSGSGQIDKRSDALVDVLRNQNFIPHLVVGLPTAGAHVAARIAGALNASAVSPEKAVELVTFRPRYVKASGDTQAVDADPATAKQKLEQAHKKILAADLRRLDLPSQRPLRVLVVDDFSSSGNSIADSKTAIRETLQIQGVDELDVRGAVSRYTSAQRNDFLGAHDVNPIDYMAGPMKSGTREEIKDYIDDDGDRMEQSMVDGLTETGFPKPKPWWKLW